MKPNAPVFYQDQLNAGYRNSTGTFMTTTTKHSAQTERTFDKPGSVVQSHHNFPMSPTGTIIPDMKSVQQKIDIDDLKGIEHQIPLEKKRQSLKRQIKMLRVLIGLLVVGLIALTALFLSS